MCRRCSKEFRSDSELQKHSESTIPCEFRPSDREGCSPEQLKLLKSKKNVSGKAEIERWRTIYLILFPHATQVPSPCKNHQKFQPHSISNGCIVCETRGNCCRRVLEEFKEFVIAELPKKIDQDIGAHFTIRIGRTKSRLKDIVCNRTEELLQTFLDRKQNPEAGIQPSRSDQLGVVSLPMNHGSGLSPNLLPRSMHLPTRNSRRRANSELSHSPKSSNPISKRIALE
jgi:hypothetical protein